jgi:hypothetical protein
MNAHHFETAQAMSDYQSERELQEALRVQGMTPAARLVWLQDTWGRLQDGASLLFGNMPAQHGTARCYASPVEKNRFDEEREINRALHMRSIG